MPVQKFHNIEEMKATPVPDRGWTLRARIAANLSRSAALDSLAEICERVNRGNEASRKSMSA